MNEASPVTLASPTATGALGLRWAGETGKLHWLEPDARRILTWQEGAGIARQKMQTGLSVLATCASGHLLVGMEKRLCIVASASRTAIHRREALADRILVTVDAMDHRTIIGGGRTDMAGHFVFGTRNVAPDQRPIGSFYQYSCRHGLRRLALPTVTWAASICFSRDGSRLYFGDAASAALRQCRYDPATASIADIQPFATAANDAAILDAVVDSDDCVWTVQGAGGVADTLVRYGPDGALRERIDLPAGQACSMAFGGAALDTLYMVGATGALSALPRRIAQGLADAPFDDTFPCVPAPPLSLHLPLPGDT